MTVIQMQELLESLNPWWKDPGRRVARGYSDRRAQFPHLLSRVENVGDRRATLLIGPRQVGKSTLLRQLADELLDRDWPPGNLTFFDFDDDRLTEAPHPREIAGSLPSQRSAELPQILLLDEISRAPNWDRWLKHAVDAGGVKILATDSAASLLADAGRESGQGRWDEVVIEGLSFAEFLRFAGGNEDDPWATLQQQPAAFERYLALGGFPESAAAEPSEEVRLRLRRDIVDRAIRRDLRRFGIDVEGARRLFVHLVRNSGSIFQVTHRATDLDVDPRSVQGWVDRLCDTMLVRQLDPFVHSTKASAELRARPKLYAGDHGLVVAFATESAPLLAGPVRDRTFETVVFRHLREAVGTQDTLGYYRSKDDHEVDFIYETDRRRAAIEVTSSPSPEERKLDSLITASRKLSASRTVLVHGGAIRSEDRRTDVLLLPLVEFLLFPRKALEV